MRIVAVADTHLFHTDLDVPDGDVFVHAGDLCRGGDLDELAEAADWIAGLPHRDKVIVAGNHDWAFVHEPARARTLLPAATTSRTARSRSTATSTRTAARGAKARRCTRT